MDPITILFALLFVGIFAAFFVIMGKKENEKRDAVLATLTEAQKEELKRNNVQAANAEGTAWTQKALIMEVTENGAKTKIYFLWFNTVITNATHMRILSGEVKMDSTECRARGLKPGDFVTIYLDIKKNSNNHIV